MYILVIVIIIWAVAKGINKNKTASWTSSPFGSLASKQTSSVKKRTSSAANVSLNRQASAIPNQSKKTASAKPNQPKKALSVPNLPRQLKRTKEEQAMEFNTRASARQCRYEAEYSKGTPKHIGTRGDYEPVTPRGMSRIRCAYCGAENFVPSGTREHYHCYFCWEKL